MQLSLRSAMKYVAAVVLLVVPLSLWALWKPIRALAPEWAGVQCYWEDVCTDDPSRVSEARALRAEAMSFVRDWAGNFEAQPRFIFCTTGTCEKTFGFKGNAAYSVGARALVVAAHGWKTYYVRHELIHCVQVERIGGFRMLLHTPTWLIEGMAYSASQDPRRPLLEPWESHRRQYESWAETVVAKELWSKAAAL